MVSSVTVCHHPKLIHYHWLYSPCCTLHPYDLFILYLDICTFGYSPTPPQTLPLGNHQNILCIHESGFVLCVCYVGMWYLISLTYFSYHNTFQVHLCCHKWQEFLLFQGWIIISHCLYITLLLHSFIDEHLGSFHILTNTNIAEVNIGVQISHLVSVFVSFGQIPKNRTINLCSSCIFTF